MTQYNVKYTAHNLISPKIIPIQSASIYSVIPVTLFGRTRLRYGSKMNENFLHLLENFACPSAVLTVNGSYVPDTNRVETFINPVDGQFWYDNRMHKMRYYSAAKGRWLDIRDDGDVAALCGIISDGEQIPLPVGRNGRTFTYSECSWMVSPFNQLDGISEMRCYTDNEARVTHTYKYADSPTVVSGIANYMIIAIGGNINLGTPRPSPTPFPIEPCTISIVGNQPIYVKNQTITWSITSRRNSTITFFIDDVQVATAILNSSGTGTISFPMPDVEEDTVIEVTAVSNFPGCGTFSTNITVLSGDEIPCSITGPSVVDEGASISVTIDAGSFPGVYTISSSQVGGTFSPAGPYNLDIGETQVVSYTAAPVTSTSNFIITSSNGPCSSNLPITVNNLNSCSISTAASAINEGTSTTITINSGAFPGTYNLTLTGGGTLSASSVVIATPNTNATVTYTAPFVVTNTNVSITAARATGGCSQSVNITVVNLPIAQCAFFLNAGATFEPGDDVSLTINAGERPGTYSFSDGGAGGTFSDGGAGGTGTSISVTLSAYGNATIIYRVGPTPPSSITLRAEGGGCVSTVDISVSIPPSCALTLTTAGTINSGDTVNFGLSYEPSAVFDRNFTLTVVDNSTSATVSTQTITLPANSTSTTASVTAGAAGSYTASITGNGCSSSAGFTVASPSTPCSVSPSTTYPNPVPAGTTYTVNVQAGSASGTYVLTVRVGGTVAATQSYAAGISTTYDFVMPISGTATTVEFTLTGPNSCSSSITANLAAAIPCSLSAASSSVDELGNVVLTLTAGSYPASYAFSATPNIGTFSPNPAGVAAGGTALVTYTAGVVSENTLVTLEAESIPEVDSPPCSSVVNVTINDTIPDFVVDVPPEDLTIYLLGTSSGPSGTCTRAELIVSAASYVTSGSGNYTYNWVVSGTGEIPYAGGAYTGIVGIEVSGVPGQVTLVDDAYIGAPSCPPNAGPSVAEATVTLTITDTTLGQSQSVDFAVGLNYIPA